MRNASRADSVFLPIVFAFALLGIASNHSRLRASALSDMDIHSIKKMQNHFFLIILAAFSFSREMIWLKISWTRLYFDLSVCVSVCLSVCLSVCPSQTWHFSITAKRKGLGTRFLACILIWYPGVMPDKLFWPPRYVKVIWGQKVLKIGHFGLNLELPSGTQFLAYKLI